MSVAAPHDGFPPEPGRITLPPSDRSGFLSRAESAPIFQAHVFIAAMARSGSTLLCDLMTVPRQRFCIVEPWFVLGVRGDSLAEQFERNAGLPKKQFEAETRHRSHARFLERYRSVLAPSLSRLERWGVKEVRPELHQPTIDTINPRRIVVLVREISSVISSLQIKNRRNGISDEQSLAWIQNYIPIAAETLIAVADRSDSLVVRYEDFIGSPDTRASLAKSIDWPLDGTPNASFDIFGRHAEAARHGGSISSYPSEAVKLPEPLFQLAAACRDYQRRFRYT